MTLAAFATFVLVVHARSLRAELDADLASRVASLAAGIAPLFDRPDVARWLAAQPGINATPLVIRRADGGIVYRSSAVASLPRDWERAAALGVIHRLPVQTIRDEGWEAQRLANHFVTSPAGSVFVVQLMAPADGIDRRVRELAVVQAIGILLVLAVARYASAFTARRALAPIDEIIRRGREIHGREPGKRLVVDADTIEIEQLVQSLNQMLERLEEPVHTAHRFAANVSHELQTPIAAMRFALEAAQRSDRPAEHYRGIADDLMGELDRLSTLVRDLRLLAVAGAGQLVVDHERIELGEVVRQCCEIARAVGEARDIAIEEQIAAGVMVTGSALHLRRVILNLTDNAIRYSPPGSTVTVGLTFDKDTAAISVADRGCGIDREDLPRIFEQFFRADRARTRDTGGSGLGLAIADQIVRAHRGRIAVASELHVGSTFTILLPAVVSSGVAHRSAAAADATPAVGSLIPKVELA